MIKVLIADDQTLFRTMLEKMLAKDEEIIVVGSVASGEEAVEKTIERMPDLVILDRQMPGKDGIWALREIKEKNPLVKVVILTGFEDTASVLHASASRADGYLIKDISPEALIMAIKCICQDMVILHRNAYEWMASTKGGGSAEQKIQCGEFAFDPVDILIMKQITEGGTNREIAKRLNYSEGTIKNRISKIMELTGFSDRTQISVFALKNHLV